jgi:hypothetical protein
MLGIKPCRFNPGATVIPSSLANVAPPAFAHIVAII